MPFAHSPGSMFQSRAMTGRKNQDHPCLRIQGNVDGTLTGVSFSSLYDDVVALISAPNR